MFWKDESGYREKISVDNTIRKINGVVGSRKIRLTTNPYNPLVIRVDFIGPEIETIFLEGLTTKTEGEILGGIKAEKLSGRYW